MIKAVLFDVDGTLLDTSNFTYQAFAYALQALGIKTVSKRRIADSVSLSLFDSYKSLTNGDQATLTTLVDRHRQFQRKNLDLIKPFLNSKKTLEILANKKIKTAVVTSRNLNVTRILKQFRLLSYFSVIISGTDVKNIKPDPESIFLALSKIKIAAENALFVGDMEVDILAGKRSGVKTFAVASGFTSKKILMQHKPDFIGNDIADVLKLNFSE